MKAIMKKLVLLVITVFCTYPAFSQFQPTVVVDNLAVTREPKGWRVVNASTEPVHFNLMKGDLIVRIDGRNAVETGPMQMASLFNEGDRREIKVFLERGVLRIWVSLREIRPQDYSPVGANPFRHVAGGFSVPDSEFTDIDGNTLTFEQYKGKWLMIEFMATWCPPCIEAMPELLRIASRDQLSLVIVALNDKTESVQRMRRRFNIVSPIVMAQATSKLPIDFGIMTNRWMGQVPGLVLVQPDGEVALVDIGGGDAAHLGKVIECAIGCKADQASK